MVDEAQQHPVDTDKTSQFIELAKLNQENLWRRRGVEWKVNYGLWTAIGIIAGFAYKEGLAVHGWWAFWTPGGRPVEAAGGQGHSRPARQVPRG